MAGINPDYPGWDYALDREFRQALEQIGMWRQLIGLCPFPPVCRQWHWIVVSENSQFLRPAAKGGIVFSAKLLEIFTLLYSRNEER